MDKAVLDRLPSAFTDTFTAMLKKNIAVEDKVYRDNVELFMSTLDESARGRALEAKGRKLAYSDILNKIMGGKNDRQEPGETTTT